jgi:hypothetical protein
VRDIAVALRPHAWINVHSGMEGLFMPYDHVARMPDGADAAASLAVLQELNRTACGGRCVVGSGGESVGCSLISGDPVGIMHFISSDQSACSQAVDTDRDHCVLLPQDLSILHTAIYVVLHYAVLKPASSAGTWRTARRRTGCTRSCTCRWRSRGRSTAT